MPIFHNIKRLFRKNVPQVLLVRHGATDFNNTDRSEDRIRGWIDVPLNAEGLAEAEEARDELAKVPIDDIYSSDLVRAKKTAEIINEKHHLPIISTTELRPWGLGIFQGKRTATILEEMNSYIKDPDKQVPEGESFNEFKVRYLSLIQHLIDEAKTHSLCIVVTTHFRNLKVVDAWVHLGMPSDLSIDVDTMLEDKFKTGEIYPIPLEKYNDTK